MVLVSLSADTIPASAHMHVHGSGWGMGRHHAAWRPSSASADLEQRARRVFERWSLVERVSEGWREEEREGGRERRLTKSQAKNALIALLGSVIAPPPPSPSLLP